jgi:hypothetical protein
MIRIPPELGETSFLKIYIAAHPPTDKKLRGVICSDSTGWIQE